MTDIELKIQFQIIDDNLNNAFEKNDIEDISKLLSDDWTILEPSTGLSNKKQFLKAIKDGNLLHTIMKKEVLQVRLYKDIAIVIGRGKNIGVYLAKPFNSEQWITNIYRKQEDTWVCIMTQEAPVHC